MAADSRQGSKGSSTFWRATKLVRRDAGPGDPRGAGEDGAVTLNKLLEKATVELGDCDSKEELLKTDYPSPPGEL